MLSIKKELNVMKEEIDYLQMKEIIDNKNGSAEDGQSPLDAPRRSHFYKAKQSQDQQKQSPRNKTKK